MSFNSQKSQRVKKYLFSLWYWFANTINPLQTGILCCRAVKNRTYCSFKSKAEWGWINEVNKQEVDGRTGDRMSGQPSRQSHYCRDKQSDGVMGRQTGNHAAAQEGSLNHAGISWAGEQDGAIRTACLRRAVVFGLRRAGRRLPAVTLRWQRLRGLGAGVVTEAQECRLGNVTGKCPVLSRCTHCNTKTNTALQSLYCSECTSDPRVLKCVNTNVQYGQFELFLAICFGFMQHLPFAFPVMVCCHRKLNQHCSKLVRRYD